MLLWIEIHALTGIKESRNILLLLAEKKEARHFLFGLFVDLIDYFLEQIIAIPKTMASIYPIYVRNIVCRLSRYSTLLKRMTATYKTEIKSSIGRLDTCIRINSGWFEC